MDPAYGERYRALYERHWWWRAREMVVLRELDRYRPPGGWHRALDVGCGDGLLLDDLGAYAAHVEGLEPDAALVSEARADRIHLRPFDGAFLPGHTYDLMLFLDVLEHLEDAAAAVGHAHALLEPGGVLVATVPAFEHLWTTHDDLNRHVTRYTKRRFADLLGGAFQVEAVRYFFRWVHPAKLLQRISERVRRPEPRPPSIPPAPVNTALYGLSRAEEILLRRVPIPVGSSLLAVARKV